MSCGLCIRSKVAVAVLQTLLRTLIGVSLIGITLTLVSCGRGPNASAARLMDRSDGHDWAGYGRTVGQQHFSPLNQINQSNLGSLGLAWSIDLPLGNTVTQPIAVDGVLYFAQD